MQNSRRRKTDSVFSTPMVYLPHFLPPRRASTAGRCQRFHPSAVTAAEALAPEHNPGQRERLHVSQPIRQQGITHTITRQSTGGESCLVHRAEAEILDGKLSVFI